MTEKKALQIVINAAQKKYDRIHFFLDPIVEKWKKTGRPDWFERAYGEYNDNHRIIVGSTTDEAHLWNALYYLKLDGGMVQDRYEISVINDALDSYDEYLDLPDEDKKFIIDLFGLDYRNCYSRPEDCNEILAEFLSQIEK